MFALIPKLDQRLAIAYHPQREGAGYFQALAFVRDGVISYTCLTPDESLSVLHLHSLLSASFICLGYHEGGRLVTWFAAIAVIILLSKSSSE